MEGTGSGPNTTIMKVDSGMSTERETIEMRSERKAGAGSAAGLFCAIKAIPRHFRLDYNDSKTLENASI